MTAPPSSSERPGAAPRADALRVITFESAEPIAVTPADPAEPLTAVLRAAGLALNTRCAEHGRCSGCLVDLLDGALADLSGGGVVEAQDTPQRLRACQTRLAPARGATIRIPVSSLLTGRAQIVSRFALRTAYELRPLDRGPYADRPEFATRAAAAARRLGAAVDIGTTTVVVCVVDLETGQILGEASAFNGQLPFGEDVLTRIELCSRDPAMLTRLQHAIVEETLAALLLDACAVASVPPADVGVITVAGNTTMLHLLAGVDPTPLGVSPFTPAFLAHRVERFGALHATNAAAATATQTEPGASAWGGQSALFARATVHLLPGAAAYIGADIVAGVLASGLTADAGPSLFIDVGTNGEIVLKNGDELLACSTAAGPAFEGVGLRCGMRAQEGAISHLKLAADYAAQLDVIGHKPPAGLCGSAYVDFLSEARRVGLLNERGRLAVAPRAADAGGTDLGPSASGPILFPGGGRGVALAPGRDGQPIVVTEADVGKLLPAKAAIAAGVQTLLEVVGLRPADIARLYLAGGFGVHLDVPAAIACGLLPGFVAEQVVPVGNTSLGGAYLALVAGELLAEMERIRQRIRIVELNRTPGFESRFIRNMRLP